MNPLHLADREFERLNFKKALDHYVELLSSNLLSPEEGPHCLERISLISKKLNIELSEKTLQISGVLFLRSGKIKEGLEVLDQLLQKESSVNFELACSSLLEIGALEKTREVAQKYLFFLKERKLATKALNFINTLPPTLLKEEDQWMFKIHFLFMKGDFTNLAVLCQELKGVKIQTKEKALELLMDLLPSCAPLWKGHDKFFQALLDLFLDGELSALAFKRERKFLLKTAFDALFKHRRPALKLIQNYAKTFKRKKLGFSAAYISDDVSDLEFFSKLEDEEAHEGEVDLGEDLYQKKEMSEVEQIKKNIHFFTITNQNEKAFQEALKLKKIDAKDPLLSQFFKEEGEVAPLHRDWIDHLLKEISAHTSKKKRHPDHTRIILKKIVMSMPFSDLDLYSSDLVFSLNALDFPEVSIELLKTLEKKIEDKKKLLNYKYLLVESLILADRPHEALDVVNDTFGQYPLLKEEKVGFAYLKGEILKDMNLTKEALQVFKFVGSLEPGFRLVKERIKDLEEGQ